MNRTISRKWLPMVLIVALMLTSVFAMPVSASADGDTAQTGTVVYNANGGKGSVTEPNVPEGSALKLPAVSRAGYKLKGWYTAARGGAKVSSATTVNFNGQTSVTYYAQWAGKKIKVKFDAAKGKLPKGAKKSKMVVVGAKYKKLPTPTREGFKFLGWYCVHTKVSEKSTVKRPRAHTLKAQWLQKGEGKTITTTEYGRLKKGMSLADARYTVGGLGAVEKQSIDGVRYTIYAWESSESKSKGAAAIFVNGKLDWKAYGTTADIEKKMKSWTPPKSGE